jgi:hypothetical protein
VTPVSTPAVSRIAARRAAELQSDRLHRVAGVAELLGMAVLLAMLGVGLVWIVKGIVGIGG